MFHGLWRFWLREPFARYFSFGFLLLFGPFVYAIVMDNLWNEALARNWKLPLPIMPLLSAQSDFMSGWSFQVLGGGVHVIGFFVLCGFLIAFIVQRGRPRAG